MRQCVIEVGEIPIRLRGDLVNKQFLDSMKGFLSTCKRPVASLDMIQVNGSVRDRLRENLNICLDNYFLANKKGNLQASIIREISAMAGLSGHYNGFSKWLSLIRKYSRQRIYFEIINPLGLLFFDWKHLKGSLYLYYNHSLVQKDGLVKLTHCLRLFLRYIYAPVILRYNGIIMHACGIVKNDKAFLFLGASGSGKTTIASLSKDLLVLSDEIVIVRKFGKRFFAYATPWWGIETNRPGGINKDLKAKICGIFLLKQDKEVFFEDVSRAKAMQNVMFNLIGFLRIIPMQQKKDILYTLAELFWNLSFKVMHFPKDNSFWMGIDRLYEGVE